MSRITKMLAAVVVAGFLAIVPAVTAQAATGGCADTNSTYPPALPLDAPTPALTPLPNATPDECLQSKDYSQAVKPPVGVDPAPNDQSNPLVGENNTGLVTDPFQDYNLEPSYSQEYVDGLNLEIKLLTIAAVGFAIALLAFVILAVSSRRQINHLQEQIDENENKSKPVFH